MAHKELIADSFLMYSADGYVMHNSRDSILAAMQKFSDGMKSLTVRVDAVNCQRSAGKNEDWVLIWGMETATQKSRKADSVHLMETWRLNKAGQADLLYHYKMQTAPKKNRLSQSQLTTRIRLVDYPLGRLTFNSCLIQHV